MHMGLSALSDIKMGLLFAERNFNGVLQICNSQFFFIR